MKMYQAGDVNADVGLLGWYSAMGADRSIAETFAPSAWPLSTFIRTFSNPENRVLYLDDEQGWYAVAWLSPCMGGLVWGFWLREDFRGEKSARHDVAFSLVMDSLDFALAEAPVVLALTRRDQTYKLTEGLGFKHLGRVPYLFEGQDCDTFYLTREGFQPGFDAWSKAYGRTR